MLAAMNPTSRKSNIAVDWAKNDGSVSTNEKVVNTGIQKPTRNAAISEIIAEMNAFSPRIFVFLSSA